MEQIETEIIEWLVARLADNDPIREQLREAKISAREFTAGAGAFPFRVIGPGPAEPAGEPSYVDGPEIRTPEMASGALVTLDLAGGVPNSLEIWSYADDYPIGRHPTNFVPAEPPKSNLIDLR